MINRLAIVLLLLLAACSSGASRTAEAQCEQRVNQDPDVRAIWQQSWYSADNPSWPARYATARNKALNTCLFNKGLPPTSGVEPVMRANYGTGWY
jgi:hypothetical protein